MLEYNALGLSPLILPTGTVGVVLDTEEEGGVIGRREERQVVSWAVEYSAWTFFAAVFKRLLVTPGVGAGKDDVT